VSAAPYILYGAYASYYTGKTRSYLRKKSIPFIERLPSHPRFREFVSPAAQSKRIPILETPDGSVIQDTTEIFEYLEPRFPSPPALPSGPRQRLASYLVDLFASENLKIAWHYRWNFPEQNLAFVTMDFGRSFKPQGADAELKRYGDIIAGQMDGHRANIGITPDMFGVLEQIYLDLLDVLERHFTTYPFLLGGLPSVGDFGLMGPLFAHLGRDPRPRDIMQARAPRVFRWVEHMNTPEIRSPEFAETPMEYLPSDEISATVTELLRRFTTDYTPVYRASADLYNDWARNHANYPAGTIISREDRDQPDLGRIAVPLRGHTMTPASQIHSLWLLQRTQSWLRNLDTATRTAIEGFAADCGAADLLSIELVRPLTRTRNRLALG
jgi:glutathione S-transferase